MLAWTLQESVSRDREDGLATGHPQGLESEAYLISTSQDLSSEDARKDVHIRGRSSRLVECPGFVQFTIVYGRTLDAATLPQTDPHAPSSLSSGSCGGVSSGDEPQK